MTGEVQFAEFGVLALLWTVVVYRLLTLRHTPLAPGRGAYCMCLVYGAATLTMYVPAVYFAFDNLLGVPNVAHVPADIFGILSCASFERFARRFNFPTETRPRVLGTPLFLLVAVIAVIATFALVRTADHSPDFPFRDPSGPFVLENRLVYLLGVGVVGVSATALCWRYGGLSRQVCSRLGFRGTAIGLALALGSAGYQALYAAMVRARFPWADVVQPAVAVYGLGLGGLTVMAFCSTLPARDRVSRLL